VRYNTGPAWFARPAGRVRVQEGYCVLYSVRRQRLQTLRRTRRPPRSIVRFWVLGNQRRLVRRLE